MTVGSICSHVVASASSHETIRTAAQRMAEHDVGTLVVLETEDGVKTVGIVTDRDIVTRCVAPSLDPDRQRVSSVMTSPVHTVDEQTPVEEAIRTMARVGARRLVVLGEADRPVGVLSLDDVLNLLAEDVGAIGRLLAKQRSHIPQAISVR